MDKKLISIVLPVYNGEKYLRTSIDSILAQTYSNWELIIVDDGSKDQSIVIAEEYAANDNRIHIIKNKQNQGLPRTLNIGFSYAEGDYLTWTSDDNLYYPTALEKMLFCLVNNDRDFVFASCDVIDESGAIIECIAVDHKSPKRLIGSNCVGACFLYSRKAYSTTGEYDPDMALVEDFDYWQRICSNFTPICISEKLYAYRWHSGALTSTMKKEQFNKTLEKMLLKNRPLFHNIDALSLFYYYQGLYKCRKNIGQTFNPYTIKYILLCCFYFIKVRIPTKIKRLFNL